MDAFASTLQFYSLELLPRAQEWGGERRALLDVSSRGFLSAPLLPVASKPSYGLAPQAQRGSRAWPGPPRCCTACKPEEKRAALERKYLIFPKVTFNILSGQIIHQYVRIIF